MFARHSHAQRFGQAHPDHPAIEYAAADFSGKYIAGARYRLGPSRSRRRSYGDVQSVRPAVARDGVLLDRVLVWVIDRLAEHERAGTLTKAEAELFRHLIFSGWTYGAIAEHEVMGTDRPKPSRQAISSRLYGRKAPSGKQWGGIAKKAPEIVEAWKFIQRCCQNQEHVGSQQTQNEPANDI